MSPERKELQRLLRLERASLRAHLGAIPSTALATANAVARKHPLWLTGGVVALMALFVSSGGGRDRKPKSGTPAWRAAIGAIGMRMLPEILSAVGAMAAGKRIEGEPPTTADTRSSSVGASPS